MERLTKRITEATIELSAKANPFQYNGSPQRVYTKHPFWNVFDKLCKYEDAEEQGLLISPPCKIGDTVYRIYDECDFPGDCHTKRMCKGCEYRNLFIDEQAFCISMLCQDGTLGHPYYKSCPEAESALAKMGGANEDTD